MAHNANLNQRGNIYSAAATRVAPRPRDGGVETLETLGAVPGNVATAVDVKVMKVSGHRTARQRLFIAGSGSGGILREGCRVIYIWLMLIGVCLRFKHAGSLVLVFLISVRSVELAEQKLTGSPFTDEVYVYCMRFTKER